MSTIPLPALAVKPVEQPDLLSQVAKVQQLRGMGQQQQIQQQQMEENQLDIQQKQVDLRDQQTVMQVLGKHGGDIESALPELASKVTAKTYLGLQKATVEMKKSVAELDNKTLENKKLQSDQFLGLIDSASKMDPQTYQQNWPAIASRALELEPELKGKVDLTQPVPQPMLAQYGMLFQTQSGALAREKETREAAAAKETARHNQVMEENNVSESKLALRAAQGDPDAEKALKRLDQSKRESRPVINNMTGNDAKDIADAIENGDQPPTLQGLYRNAAPVRAELARRGVPVAQMELDWKAVQKHIQTLNGPQQERLRQSITSASDMLDKIDGLYQEWSKVAPTSGFKILNKASLTAMKNLPGRAGAVATALDAQIADLTADLGNVYMGGNSPTDHALGLAGKNLQADWNQATFEEALKQARANLKIRENSIRNSQPVGLSGTTNYLPNQQQTAPATGGMIRARDKQGKLHEAPAGTPLPDGWNLEK